MSECLNLSLLCIVIPNVVSQADVNCRQVNLIQSKKHIHAKSGNKEQFKIKLIFCLEIVTVVSCICNGIGTA